MKTSLEKEAHSLISTISVYYFTDMINSQQKTFKI